MVSSNQKETTLDSVLVVYENAIRRMASVRMDSIDDYIKLAKQAIDTAEKRLKDDKGHDVG